MVEAQGHGMEIDEPLADNEQAEELLLMGLRLSEGVDLARWRLLSGRDLDAGREAELKSYGMVERLAADRLRATPAGMLVLDRVLAELA